MSKKFREINASFKEPKTLAASTCIGAISLAAGASFFGLSTIKIGVDDDKTSTYHLSFMVVEDTDSAYDLVKHDVVLVKDLTQFEFDGSALLLGDLRKQGNCGGHVMLISHSSAPIQLFPALQTDVVSIYSERSKAVHTPEQPSVRRFAEPIGLGNIGGSGFVDGMLSAMG